MVIVIPESIARRVREEAERLFRIYITSSHL